MGEQTTKATLSVDIHCQMLSAAALMKSQATYEGFKLFVQMFSAVVAGTVFLRFDKEPSKIPASFLDLTNAMAFLVTVVSGIIIYDAYRSWYGYRVKLAEIAGPGEVPSPSHTLSSTTLWAMYLAMGAALILFWMFNPLKS